MRRRVTCDKDEAEEYVVKQIQERFRHEIKVTQDEGKSNKNDGVYNMSLVNDVDLKGRRTSATTAAEIEKLWIGEHSDRSCINVGEAGQRKPQKETQSWLSSNRELRQRDTSCNVGCSPGERSGSHPKLAHSSSWPQRVDRTMFSPVQGMLFDVESKKLELGAQLPLTSQLELTSIDHDVRERSSYATALPMETSFVQEVEKGLLRNDNQQQGNVSLTLEERKSVQSYSSLSQAQGTDFSFKENQMCYNKSFKQNSISVPISVGLSQHKKESYLVNSEAGQKSISVLRVEHGRDDSRSKDSQREHSRNRDKDHFSVKGERRMKHPRNTTLSNNHQRTSDTTESQFTTSSCNPVVGHLLKNLRAINQIVEEEKPENVSEQGYTSKKGVSSKFEKGKKDKKAHEDLPTCKANLPTCKANKNNAKSITNSKGKENGRKLLLHNKFSDGKVNRNEFTSAADNDKAKEDVCDNELSSSGGKKSVQNTTSPLPISLSAVSSTQPSSCSLSPSTNNLFTKLSSNLPRITDILRSSCVISSPNITNLVSSCSPSNEVGTVTKSLSASSTVSSSSTCDVTNTFPTSCVVSPISDSSLSPVKSVSSNCSSVLTDNSSGAAQVRNNSANSLTKLSIPLSATMPHKVKIVSSDSTSPEIASSNSTLISSTGSSFSPLPKHLVIDSHASSSNAITVVSRRGKYSSEVLPDTTKSANNKSKQPPLPPPLPPTISPPPLPDSNPSVSYANPPPVNRQINPPPFSTLPTTSTPDSRDKLMFGNAVFVQQNPCKGEGVYEQMLCPLPLQLPQQPPTPDTLNQGYIYSATDVAAPNRPQTFGHEPHFSETHCVPPHLFSSALPTSYGILQNQRYPHCFFGSSGFFQSRPLGNFQPCSQGISEGREYHSPSNIAPATSCSPYFESPRVNYSVDFNALPTVFQQQSTNADKGDPKSSVVPSCQASRDKISNDFSHHGSAKHNTNTHLDQISPAAKTKSSDAVKEIFDILKRNRTPGDADVESQREVNDEIAQVKENCHVNVESRQDRSFPHSPDNREILADKENKSSQEEMSEIDPKPSSSDNMQVLDNNTSLLTKELDLLSEKDGRVEKEVVNNEKCESDSSKGCVEDKEKDSKISRAVKPVVPKDSSRPSPAMHCGLDVVNNLLGSESEENFTETESPCRTDKKMDRSDESSSVTTIMLDEVTETDGQPGKSLFMFVSIFRFGEKLVVEYFLHSSSLFRTYNFALLLFYFIYICADLNMSNS